jgi:hypothetical protein
VTRQSLRGTACVRCSFLNSILHSRHAFRPHNFEIAGVGS